MSRKTFQASSPLKEHELSAVVTVGAITAAKLGVPVGTEVDLGVISYYHRNPLIRWWRRHTRIKRHVLNP